MVQSIAVGLSKLPPSVISRDILGKPVQEFWEGWVGIADPLVELGLRIHMYLTEGGKKGKKVLQ